MFLVNNLFSVHLVDIYNVIEAFRENNLHGDALNGDSEVSVGKLEATLSTVYYYLNKRLPSTHQLNVEQALSMLMGWILGAYDPDFTGSVKVISIKVALSTLCSGKYVDKLKCECLVDFSLDVNYCCLLIISIASSYWFQNIPAQITDKGHLQRQNRDNKSREKISIVMSETNFSALVNIK